MSIASRIQEMETHISNAYTSMDNLGIDISNTNKNIYNISTLLDTFYEKLPKVSGIGASLNLSPTMVGKIKLNEIQGNTLQNGTPTPSSPVPIQSVTGLQNVGVCGKNLINGLLDNSTTGKKLERTINANENFYLYIKTNNTTSDRCYAFLDSTNVGTIWVSNNNGTLTFSGSRNFTFNRIRIQDNTTVSENMLTLGSSSSTYEPYKGNTYEVNLGNIELNKIGTYQDSIKKSTEKNLYNLNTSGDNKGIDYSFNGSSLYLDGTTSEAGQIVATSQHITLKAGTYNFSSTTNGTFTANNKSVAIYFKKVSDGTNIINLNNTNSYVLSSSFTLTEDTEVYVQIYTNGSGFVFNNFNIYIMLNEGTALPYEPYGKVWYIHKATGSATFNGSENWQKGTNTYQFYLPRLTNMLGSSSLIINRFINQETASNNGLWLSPNFINANYLECTTVEQFKTWLASNNVKVLYILETPTYTAITNTELIEQLESLNNAKSKDGTTNINVTSEDLSMILNVGVLKGE